MAYLLNHFGSNIVVVNNCDKNSKNIKAVEQSQRTTIISKSFEDLFNESMEVPIRQDKFLSN